MERTKLFTSAEINLMARDRPSLSQRDAELLVWTLQSREGTLRRLHRAVIATPLEGTELREAMREAELALGLE